MRKHGDHQAADRPGCRLTEADAGDEGREVLCRLAPGMTPVGCTGSTAAQRTPGCRGARCRLVPFRALRGVGGVPVHICTCCLLSGVPSVQACVPVTPILKGITAAMCVLSTWGRVLVSAGRALQLGTQSAGAFKSCRHHALAFMWMVGHHTQAHSAARNISASLHLSRRGGPASLGLCALGASPGAFGAPHCHAGMCGARRSMRCSREERAGDTYILICCECPLATARFGPLVRLCALTHWVPQSALAITAGHCPNPAGRHQSHATPVGSRLEPLQRGTGTGEQALAARAERGRSQAQLPAALGAVHHTILACRWAACIPASLCSAQLGLFSELRGGV